nr:hypothetical protein [Tanacetum cinerariifolium]
MDVPIEQDDLNHKFWTSLAPEWLVYTIIWRNRDDLDTMSLDDVYNHFKVYEPKVQKRAGSNSQNMAFISSSNTNSEKVKFPRFKEFPLLVLKFPLIALMLLPLPIDDDHIEEMDIKWNLALLSMRADRSPRSQDRGKRERESYKKDPKVEEPAFKEMIAIDEEVPIEYALMAKSSSCIDNKMGLPEFVDDTVTDYTRPTPNIDVTKSVSKELEERWKSNNPFFFEQGGSSGNVVSKPMIMFVKESGCLNATKVNNTKNARKPTVKYAEIYRKTSQSSRGISPDNIDDKGYWDSGCSRHMTGNISYLSEYEPFNGGYV